jgi:flagellar basal body-associated protein FliL
MHGAIIVAIIFSGVVMALAVIGGTILMAIKLFKGGNSHHDRQASAKETRMIQEIYRNLTRMEERVEALEIILSEKETKG